MNLLHVRYAVEIARAGSVNRASELLLIAQPNLSRSVKELEADLGITIFDRSTKGMLLTPEGQEFISHAKKILEQIDELEGLYTAGRGRRQRLSAAAFGADYISSALAELTASVSEHKADIYYEEANAENILRELCSSTIKLGVIRHEKKHVGIFESVLRSKGLTYEMLCEHPCVILASKDSDLFGNTDITPSDLSLKTEIHGAEHFIPPSSDKTEHETGRHIFIGSRASRLEVLRKDPNTYMYTPAVSDEILTRYSLRQAFCTDDRIYSDALVYRKDHRLTSLDKRFAELLRKASAVL